MSENQASFELKKQQTAKNAHKKTDCNFYQNRRSEVTAQQISIFTFCWDIKNEAIT